MGNCIETKAAQRRRMLPIRKRDHASPGLSTGTINVCSPNVGHETDGKRCTVAVRLGQKSSVAQ